jgi:hypothetical protein
MKMPRSTVMSPSIMACVMLSTGCVGPSLKAGVVRPEPSYAKPPAPHGILADTANRIGVEHGAESSGFKAERR